ncbi:hypothetical protein C8J36_101378 [Rhizobium sp. PP-F2F-G48]|uniref:hypothetical protein n=1 Tax=Rhizobium sp. PP-F2F-G48 TaxID=2135651 RepID=UPI0010DAB9D7|nr:hypothetical protein [Rhizobium sp. PP-F2F-G48]TCM58477.1 hypothetical protein C8J36_101378 [Rhizobium sp. PP-F2F-G48]
MRILFATTTNIARSRARASLCVLPFLFTLSSCNSIDALTPPENVGDGSYQSSPVNQADLDTMSSQQPVVSSAPDAATAVHEMRVQRSASLSDPNDNAQPNITGTAYARGDEDYRNPAGSFEAQVQALASNPPPQISANESAVGFPATGNQVSETEAAARTQTPEAQAPDAEQAETLENDVPAVAGSPPQEEAAIAPAAKAGPVGSIRFLPIMGAPVEAIRPLSEQLGAEARSNGLIIKTAADPGSQHILKGYFSAFKDGRKTTIVYVWDVLDQAGNRLHRIQGQDSVDTKGADLWSGVPPQTMRDIASKSVGQYLAWRDASAG